MNETRRRVGEYSLVKKIGEGGMGVVYRATDIRLGRTVALKMMTPEAAAFRENRERFLREARLAASVAHDNIVAVHTVGEAIDGTPYMVMPLLAGESLHDRLKRDPEAPPGLILKVAREVAAGLAAAHDAGLIHRDIKPGNIWLEGDPRSPDPAVQVKRCKILDFGLARSADASAVQLTVKGSVLGTPAYMSPEQAQGATLDARTDLWSLGVLLYQMAARELPFKGNSELEIVLAIGSDTPPRVGRLNPDLPPELARLVDRLLSKDPAKRPPSAAAVEEALTRVHELPMAEEAEDLPADEPRGGGWGWLLVVLVLVALVPLGWLLAGKLAGR